jgi:undecaprenyl-diphosphatase
MFWRCAVSAKCGIATCVSPFIAFVLGLVEGLTEYLPVSSTGHLLLVSRALKLQAGPIDSFDIVIQFGAILAVLVHYRALLATKFALVLKGKPEGLQLLTHLVVGFIPTAIVGLIFRKGIKRVLFGPVPVLVAMVVGGVLILALHALKFGEDRKETDTASLHEMTVKQAFLVGLGQCFSLIPGASRSLCTILAGRAAGLSMTLAAEFSFLLGLPTLGAACIYEGYKERAALTSLGGMEIAIGTLTSFLVAWAVIAVFIRYLQTRGLAVFGVYRVIVGALGLWLLL